MNSPLSSELAAFLISSAKLGAKRINGYSCALAANAASITEKGMQIGSIFCIPKIPGEVLTCDFDMDNLSAFPTVILDPALMLIGPEIEGLGEVSIHKTPKGFVIISENLRQVDRVHSDKSFIGKAPLLANSSEKTA